MKINSHIMSELQQPNCKCSPWTWQTCSTLLSALEVTIVTTIAGTLDFGLMTIIKHQISEYLLDVHPFIWAQSKDYLRQCSIKALPAVCGGQTKTLWLVFPLICHSSAASLCTVSCGILTRLWVIVFQATG